MNLSEPTENLTDAKAEQLLELIHIAVTEFGATSGEMTLRDFVEDITMSMDFTTNRADQLRQLIEVNLA